MDATPVAGPGRARLTGERSGAGPLAGAEAPTHRVGELLQARFAEGARVPFAHQCRRDGTDEGELLSLAVAVEALSDHPLAQAIVNDGRERLNGRPLPTAGDLKSLTGRGVTASVDGETVWIGKAEMFGIKEIFVDDLREVRMSVRAMLEALRVTQIAEAKNVEEALAALKAQWGTQARSAFQALASLKAVGTSTTMPPAPLGAAVRPAPAKAVAATAVPSMQTRH